MQRPLDVNRLHALADDSIEAETIYVEWAKKYFGRQNLSEGTMNLIIAFELFLPFLKIDDRICEDIERGPTHWHIDMGNRPFTHLSIKPNPEHPAVIEIYEDEKHLQTYEMFGRPEQWQAFLKWLWNYGNDRLIRQAAIQARRNASRKHVKSQVPSDASRSSSSRGKPTHKDSPDSVLYRPLRPRQFKTQVVKSKGKRIPSRLGMASLLLTDIEGGAEEDQTLREKDLNGRTATVSPTESSADGKDGI